MQQYELARIRNFTRRAAVLGAGKLVLLSLVGSQLYNLQIVKREKYRTQADQNRINIRLVPPPRGRIFDRSGRLIAQNKHVVESCPPEKTTIAEDVLIYIFFEFRSFNNFR